MRKPDNEKLRGLFFVAILILLAPLAIELILVAQIVGAEVAVLFLFAFLRHQWQLFEAKLDACKAWVVSVIAITLAHPVSEPKHFYLNAALSVGVFTFTGSLFYVTAIWYPVVLAVEAANFG